MICLRCPKCYQSTEFLQTQLNLEVYNIYGVIDRYDCKICNQYVAIKLNDEIIDVNIIYRDKFGSTWKEVQTNEERLFYYILSQIIYPEVDTPRPEKLESLYDFADEFDKIILRWENGKAIGFYTVKPKGTEVVSTKERYVMPTLDTAYIRSEYRNKGLGSSILFDMVKHFPDEDIGFSKPISEGMLRVLKKFLKNYKEYRLRFWEIADWDINGSQQLIWFGIKNRFL